MEGLLGFDAFPACNDKHYASVKHSQHGLGHDDTNASTQERRAVIEMGLDMLEGVPPT